MDRALTRLSRRAAFGLPLLLVPGLLRAEEAAPPFALGALPAAPTEWLGPAMHLAARGTLDGRPVGVATNGLDLGPDAQSLHATRRYAPRNDPGHAGWRCAALTVQFQARMRDVALDLGLEIAGDDFLQRPTPEGPWTYDLVDDPAPEGARALLLVSAGLAGPDSFGSAVAVQGWTGRLSLALDHGRRDADALLLDGRLGGFLEATRGADRMALSFTAPVTGWVKGA